MGAESTSTIRTLAGFISQSELAPSRVAREQIRLALIDTLGCIIAGSRLPVAAKTRTAIADAMMFGAEGSFVFGTKNRAPPMTAAFLNATAGHALEFDDWEIPGNTHPSIVLFPALLAASVKGASGNALVDAYTAGFEVIARLGDAMNFEHYDRGWHTTMSLGCIGAAGAVARLWQLPLEHTANALSIAVTRASGYTCQFGSDVKALHAGFAAEIGVQAATLARAGVCGQAHAIDHPKGFAALLAHTDKQRVENAMKKVGTTLAIDEYGLLFKPWPSCGYTHRLMCCAIQLRHEKIDHKRITAIEMRIPDFHAAILPYQKPSDRREALFSLPFCVAMALLEGHLSPNDLATQTWNRDDVQALISVCSLNPFTPQKPELNYDAEQPDQLILTMADGHAFEATCAYPLGAPQNPMSAEQIVNKFCDNTGLSRDAQIVASLLSWQQNDNVCDIVAVLGERNGKT
ncbi:MAG: MmgE/PrpD family protein [Pseudomonadota bacterium]